jgi:hypothetical protein
MRLEHLFVEQLYKNVSICELYRHNLTFALFIRALFNFNVTLFKAKFAKKFGTKLLIKAALHWLIDSILANIAVIVII